MNKWVYMDKFLNNHIKTGPAGCGCAVMKDGEVIFENYYGFSDIKEEKRITESSVYRQFSTTKLVTITAAMILFERGEFLLNDPISKYFPEWSNPQVADKLEDGTYNIRPATREIQVKDCFAMTMGIGYGGDDYTHQMMEKVRNELKIEVGDYTLRQDIYAMSKVPIMFDPGSHWLYGFGHELVAGLIEVISGKTVGKFLAEELFEPLGMNSTGYRYFGDMREQMVTLYEINEHGIRVPIKEMFDERLEVESKYEGGGSGLFSSVRDYLAFSQMLASGGSYKGNKIIGRKTIDLIRTNQLNKQQLSEFRNPYLDGYGYGLGVRTMMDPSKGSNTSIGEFGWTGMLGTYVAIDPTECVSLVYMHNLQPNMEEYTHQRVRNIAFGAMG